MLCASHLFLLPLLPNLIFSDHSSEDVFVCLYPIGQHLLNFSLKSQVKYTRWRTIPNSLPCSGLNKSLAPPSLTAGTAHGIHSCSRIRHAEVKLFVYVTGSYSKLWASRARPPERPMKMQIPEPDSSFPESELLGTESEKLHFQIDLTEHSLSPLQSEAGSLESKAFTYHSQWHTGLLSSTWSLPWLFMSSH